MLSHPSAQFIHYRLVLVLTVPALPLVLSPVSPYRFQVSFHASRCVVPLAARHTALLHHFVEDLIGIFCVFSPPLLLNLMVHLLQLDFTDFPASIPNTSKLSCALASSFS